MRTNAHNHDIAYSREVCLAAAKSAAANEPIPRMVHCVLRGLQIAVSPHDDYKPCEQFIKRGNAVKPVNSRIPTYVLNFDRKLRLEDDGDVIIERQNMDQIDQSQLCKVEYAETDDLALQRAEALFAYWSLDENNDDRKKRVRAKSNMFHLKEIAKKYNMPCTYMR
uniref:Ras-associating domain-containing protein n=1 Tax=Steinernema glaseri TaxID=37863 RepID=A0A1I7Y0B3_9BILA